MLTRRDAGSGRRHRFHPRTTIIDDCALARALKAQGPIWLGLTNRAVSQRPYENLTEIRRMVARSAYAELQLFAAMRLLGTLAGMLALVYVAAGGDDAVRRRAGADWRGHWPGC